jgi:hypothetical protein
MATKNDDLAQAAYQAYATEARGVSHRGEPLPAWHQLGDRVRDSWAAAAAAVAQLVTPR